MTIFIYKDNTLNFENIELQCPLFFFISHQFQSHRIPWELVNTEYCSIIQLYHFSSRNRYHRLLSSPVIFHLKLSSFPIIPYFLKDWQNSSTYFSVHCFSNYHAKYVNYFIITLLHIFLPLSYKLLEDKVLLSTSTNWCVKDNLKKKKALKKEPFCISL